MVDWSDSLHVAYIHADTLFTEEIAFTDSARMDSTYRRVRAHHGVRVYRDDAQMICDSMVYLGSDSTMHLYINPICWSDNQQISADSMTVFIVDDVVEHMVGNGNALCIMEDSLDYFNQMSGKEVTAYMKDGEVDYVDMSGNALTVYYAKEDGGDYVGLNTTESSFIRMYVENRQIHRIRFTKETTGILYPMDQIPEGTEKLSTFFWADDVRPTGPGYEKRNFSSSIVFCDHERLGKGYAEAGFWSADRMGTADLAHQRCQSHGYVESPH